MTMRTSIQKNRGLLAATAVALITLLAGPSPAVTGTAVFCSSVSARSYDTYRDVFGPTSPRPWSSKATTIPTSTAGSTTRTATW